MKPSDSETIEHIIQRTTLARTVMTTRILKAESTFDDTLKMAGVE